MTILVVLMTDWIYLGHILHGIYPLKLEQLLKFNAICYTNWKKQQQLYTVENKSEFLTLMVKNRRQDPACKIWFQTLRWQIKGRQNVFFWINQTHSSEEESDGADVCMNEQTGPNVGQKKTVSGCKTHTKSCFFQHVVLWVLQCVCENCYDLNLVFFFFYGTFSIFLHIEEPVHSYIRKVLFSFLLIYFNFSQKHHFTDVFVTFKWLESSSTNFEMLSTVDKKNWFLF